MTLQTERDTFRDETRDLCNAKESLVKEKNIVVSSYKDKVSGLEGKVKLLTDVNEKLVVRALGTEK